MLALHIKLKKNDMYIHICTHIDIYIKKKGFFFFIYLSR